MLHSEIHTRENNVRDILLRMFTQRNLSSKQWDKFKIDFIKKRRKIKERERTHEWD